MEEIGNVPAQAELISVKTLRQHRHMRSTSTSAAGKMNIRFSSSGALMNKKYIKSSAVIPPGIDRCHLLGRTADDHYVVTDGTSSYRLDVDKVHQHISPKVLEWFECSVTEYEKSLIPKSHREQAHQEPQKALSNYVSATWVLPLACYSCSEASRATNHNLY